MSTSTAVPTISVTPEEAETIRIDPYYIAMMEGASVEHFDLNTTRPMCEHIEWLEGQQAHLERWVAVLRQLDDGVLVAEPWIIETVRKNAVGLHDDSLYHNDGCGGSCNCADIEQRSAALHALADRLEAALVESPRIKLDSIELESLMDKVVGNALGGAGQDCDPYYSDTAEALKEGPHALRPQVEAVAQDLARWAMVLQQLENSALVAEPWLIERIRGSARDMDLGPEDSEYPKDAAIAAEWRKIYDRNAVHFAALNAVADRLVASVPQATCRGT